MTAQKHGIRASQRIACPSQGQTSSRPDLFPNRLSRIDIPRRPRKAGTSRILADMQMSKSFDSVYLDAFSPKA
jgi:hypothetical protein